MRRILLAALLLAAPACKRAPTKHVDTIEEAPRLATMVRMNDATMAGQLTSGFYGVESGAWRWTAQKFAVTLRPPAHAAQNGATLEFRLTVPAANLQKLGAITLSASVGGTALAPETYGQAGAYTYRRDIPASALTGDAVRIDFQVDKAVPPGDVDKRELGVVASGVSLAAK